MGIFSSLSGGTIMADIRPKLLDRLRSTLLVGLTGRGRGWGTGDCEASGCETRGEGEVWAGLGEQEPADRFVSASGLESTRAKAMHAPSLQ